MHNLKILINGPENFISTLTELKPYLKFDLVSDLKSERFNGLICHESNSKDKQIQIFFKSDKFFRILATNRNTKNFKNFDYILKLPTSIEDINNTIQNSAVKKKFNATSSIKLKNSYVLDKNEKKLLNNNKFITLTEREIQLLELFLDAKNPISKNEILHSVWNYSEEADTHTVETHIYRLRKKINSNFSDDKFILNHKNGYSF